MDDHFYLKRALALARESTEPVACASILVDQQGHILAETFNTQRMDGLTASHAEMKAIAQANRQLGRKLKGVTAYGNCEPCTMCLTALIFAGVDRVVFVDRMNDFAGPNEQIDIDCFEFVRRFPHYPKLEQIKL
jgi:tRNA(Arg) A34 adenosine deaminase TadA